MRKKGEHAIGSPDPNKKRADESKTEPNKQPGNYDKKVKEETQWN